MFLSLSILLGKKGIIIIVLCFLSFYLFSIKVTRLRVDGVFVLPFVLPGIPYTYNSFLWSHMLYDEL